MVGMVDPALTDVGVQDSVDGGTALRAALLNTQAGNGHHLLHNMKRIFSSTMRRTMETAYHMKRQLGGAYANVQIQPIKGIKESGMGAENSAQDTRNGVRDSLQPANRADMNWNLVGNWEDVKDSQDIRDYFASLTANVLNGGDMDANETWLTVTHSRQMKKFFSPWGGSDDGDKPNNNDAYHMPYLRVGTHLMLMKPVPANPSRASCRISDGVNPAYDGFQRRNHGELPAGVPRRQDCVRCGSLFLDLFAEI
jgi:broad specificity phosphatase PhoE